ncbi:MAG: hypothetical protein Q9185_001670 [Variospora sp. 1 TL-2023]
MAVHETPTASAAAAADETPPAVEIIASPVPWADKEERLLSLFRSIAAHAEKHEPGCTRYLIYVHPSTSPSSPGRRDLENQGTRLRGSKIEIVERYTTPAAFEEHTRSEPFRALVQALGEEELLSEDPGTIEESMVRVVAGFE